MNGRIWLLAFLFPLFFVACQKPTGNVCLDLKFAVDGQPLQQDTCQYVNAAGNHYSVTEAQYFICNVILTHSDGTQVVLNDGEAHYVDADITSTLSWPINNDIPVGNYTTATFVFGLSPEWNQNYMFPNPPENAMSWPANLGGGYHNMKINGWWIDPNGQQKPFNLHSGRGQQYDENGNITGFIDNHFTVSIPLSNGIVKRGETTTIPITMDINRWFDGEILYDFNVIGGSIMQNQAAQEILKANGKHAFSDK